MRVLLKVPYSRSPRFRWFVRARNDASPRLEAIFSRCVDHARVYLQCSTLRVVRDEMKCGVDLVRMRVWGCHTFLSDLPSSSCGAEFNVPADVLRTTADEEMDPRAPQLW